MSWFVYGTDLDDLRHDALSLQPPAPLDQLEAALIAARSIAASGAVGKAPFTYTLNGHGNFNHEPQNGYANDSITVTVTQA